MRLTVVGSGYVGLVTGACFAESGNDVICVDIDAAKVKLLSSGTCPIFEPGLEELLQRNLGAGRLTFTQDLRWGIVDTEAIFLCVGTPPKADGSADLSAVEGVVVDIAKQLSGPAVVVTKSTVPVGTGHRLMQLLREHSSYPCSVVSNPEFLKEGTAVDDFLRPDRVVVGSDDPDAASMIGELYEPYVRNNRPILQMSLQAAEMTKYASNAYLSTRISFINEIAELCERLGIDVNEVRRGMGADARIGYQFLYPGVGYGGSCFPKDVQALVATGRMTEASVDLLSAVHARNERQRQRFADRILARLGPDPTGKRVAIWGAAFKPKTDDIRCAPSLSVIERLLDVGARVVAFDPEAGRNVAAVFGERVAVVDRAYDALDAADALIICTEWLEFRSPDFKQMVRRMKQALVFDGRNLYEARTMQRYGFEYHSIGRPAVMPAEGARSSSTGVSGFQPSVVRDVPAPR